MARHPRFFDGAILKRFGSIVALAATLLLLAGCGKAASDAPAPNVLRVATMKGALRSMMIASGALENAPYRVEWSEFPVSQHMLEAISADAVDIGTVGDAPFQFAYQNGAPIKAVSARTFPYPMPGSLGIIVPKGSPVRSIQDLAGKSIAATRGSTGHDIILRALEKAGLPASAVKINFLSPVDGRAAFSSGAVDAWAIWMPYLATAAEDGARIIVDSANFPGGYYFEAVNDNAIKDKRAILADFLQREATAFQWVKTHQPEYTKAFAADTGMPMQIAKDTVSKIVVVNVPMDDKVIGEQQKLYDRFRKAGAMSGSRPFADAYDRSLFNPR